MSELNKANGRYLPSKDCVRKDEQRKIVKISDGGPNIVGKKPNITWAKVVARKQFY